MEKITKAIAIAKEMIDAEEKETERFPSISAISAAVSAPAIFAISPSGLDSILKAREGMNTKIRQGNQPSQIGSFNFTALFVFLIFTRIFKMI